MDIDLIELAISKLHARVAVYHLDNQIEDWRDIEALRLAVLAAKEIGRPLRGIDQVIRGKE